MAGSSGIGTQSHKLISLQVVSRVESTRWGIYSGVIPEWEDLPKMAGEDARIWKGWFRIPNPPSR